MKLMTQIYIIQKHWRMGFLDLNVLSNVRQYKRVINYDV